MIPQALLDLQDLAEEEYEARAPHCLAQVPALVLSVGSPNGGRYTLVHGPRRETAEPVEPAFEALKYVAHAPLGMFALLFPHGLTPEPPDAARLEALLSQLEGAEAAVNEFPVPDSVRPACLEILQATVGLCRRLSQGAVSRAEFDAYSADILKPTEQTMAVAAQVQVDGIRTLLEGWRREVGPSDWARAVGAVGSGWARVNNSPRLQVMAEVLGGEHLEHRLFCIQGAKSEEALLQTLAKILNQHQLGELFFREEARLDEDLMGRPAARILCQRNRSCVVG